MMSEKLVFEQASDSNQIELHKYDGRHKMKCAQCKFCHNIFYVEGELHAHLQTVHGKDYFQVCQICGKYFLSATGFKHHHNLMHSSQKSGPQCQICGKYFGNESNLLVHLKSHSKERPFCCDVCLKSFKYKHHLKTHVCTGKQ